MAAETDIDDRRISYAMRVKVEDASMTALEVQVLLDAMQTHAFALQSSYNRGEKLRSEDWRSLIILRNLAAEKARDIEVVLDQFCEHDALSKIDLSYAKAV